MPAATICVAATKRCEVSGAEGEFRFGDLRAGVYRLEITIAGQTSIVTEPVPVRAGLDQRLELIVPPASDALEQTVTVTASSVVAAEIKSSRFLVPPEAILKDAGALQDVSRFVQSLPGVVIGSNDFRNDIIVRGGSPLENLFIVDNVEVPNINTFANFASAGGTVSILDANLIQDVTFLTGGYPAAFQNRTSSVLQVTQREGNRQRFGGRGTVGFAGAGGILEGPLRDGRGSWIVSARRSFLDVFTNDVGFGGVPVLYTFNGKAVYDVGPSDRLWLVNLTGVDRIRLGLTDSLDLEEEIANFDIRYQGWRSATGFNWQHIFGQRGVGLLGVTHSSARVVSTVKDLVHDGPIDGLPVEEAIARGPVVFREDSGEDETTVKYDATAYSRMGKLQAGGSLKLFRIGYDAASPFGSDNPYAPSGSSDAFILDSRLTTSQTGGYLQGTFDLAKRINLTAGGRVDNYALLGQTRLSPRAGITVQATGKLSVYTTTGIYYQQPPFLFLTAFPENQQLVPFRATHVVAGAAWRLAPTIRLTVEAYRKEYRDYPVAAAYPTLSLANLGDTFNVREVLFPLVSDGTGRADGIELFAERRGPGPWSGQATLAFARARHAGLDGVRRPGSYDYPVVFNATGTRRLNARWEIAGRVSYLGGRPYTPFDIAASTAQRRGVYDLTRVNAERLPAYFRIDARVDRTFTFGAQVLLIFAGAQNVTGHRNVAQDSWNRRTNTSDRSEQLGVFPLVGLDWRF